MTCRRGFLRALCAAALFAANGCVDVDILVSDVSYYVDKARCNLRVGVLSEAHFAPSHSDKAMLKALSYFREREVDAVVFAGDVTQDGNLVQRRGLKRLWDKVFPDGKRRDGSPVALIVVTGEQDNEKVYEELTGLSYSTVFKQEVKGYAFIGANWQDATGVDARALRPLLVEQDKSKPFFYIQNLVPYATCCPYETKAEVFDGGKVSYMLSKFPNAVAFCGRSHAPLTDESAFWHGDFSCVNAGSFSHTLMRDNGKDVWAYVRHGLVVSVYDSSVVFERIDFDRELSKAQFHEGIYVEKLGKDWAVALPAKPSARPETPAPQFWDDTRLMVFPSEQVVSVRFPPVLAKHTGIRAYGYEVRWAKGGEGGERLACSPASCQSEDCETKPVVCNFPRAELPKGTVRFEVTPLDAFGKRGRPISAEVTL